MYLVPQSVLFLLSIRKTTQKRNGHCQAEAGEDSKNQQAQSGLCVILRNCRV